MTETEIGIETEITGMIGIGDEGVVLPLPRGDALPVQIGEEPKSVSMTVRGLHPLPMI